MLEGAGNVYLAAGELTIAFLPPAHAGRLDARLLAREGDLARAVPVYCGDLLPDFLDDWANLMRERLRAIFDRTRGRLLD